MEKESRIYIAGHKGLVGSAILRKLESKDNNNLITASSQELDLRDQGATADFFASQKPEYVFLAAARVGGIMSNINYPAEFIYDNLLIQSNVIHQSFQHGVKKLLFLGSSCIYPKDCPQPMKEEYLLTGPFEPTNEPYAVAKVTGLTMCQAYNRQYGTNYISVIPTNVFGPGDNFDLENAHVLPALLRKFHEAKLQNSPQVEVWGSGNPRREFIFSEDLAEACLFLMLNYHEIEPVNIGTGKDISIRELAGLIREIVGYKGDIVFNSTRPDGMTRKLLDVSRLNQAGWYTTGSLVEKIAYTYRWLQNNREVTK